MDYIYTWANEEHTSIKRECEAMGECLHIPVAEGNRHYREFLESGVEPNEFVAPPAGPEPTAEEKLAASGLSVEELKGLLGL
ncbi:hypothetical protein [Synechococcus phage S-N03]|uniref:Uncharacterized protein n=1 Tax=Synechococcus phage S-N03 TaxID=2718943 RepID=A0A6G8R673_9CAUD|nr:hypothetical protein PQC09_gp194 [Synechococcus phage S-N03]QIN96873.1 hypothetical protein [Synechococcus phage S-N03]